MCSGVRTPKCDERDAALRWLQRETYRIVRSSAKASSASTKRLLLALILRQAPEGFGGSHPRADQKGCRVSTADSVTRLELVHSPPAPQFV